MPFAGTTVFAEDRIATLNRINRTVNRSIRYWPDYGGDVWKIGDRYGDCEDYALRKIVELAKLGIEAEIGVYHLPDGTGHAVAIVDGLALDNRTNELFPAGRMKWKGKLRGNSVYATEIKGKPWLEAPFVMKTVQH